MTLENEDLRPRLCTGTFLTLLIGARKQREGSRGRDYKTSDGMSNFDMLMSLMNIADPQYSIKKKKESHTLSSITSSIKTCKCDSSEYYDPKRLLEKIEEQLEKGRQAEVTEACENFIEKYIDGGRNNTRLAAALLWMVRNDPELGTTDNISQKICSSLADIISNIEKDSTLKISLPVLFEYIWLYILRNVPENTCGKETIEHWRSFDKEQDIVAGLASFENYDIILLHEDVSTRIQKTKEKLSSTVGEEPFKSHSFPLNEAEANKNEQDTAILARFVRYLVASTEKFSYIKTLLYDKEPVNFYSFYVPNDIIIYRRGRVPVAPLIDSLYMDSRLTVAADSFNKIRPKKILITGMGGLGKSMMMRHLFLQTAQKSNIFKRIPFFVPLKGYKDERFEIIQLVHTSATIFDPTLSITDVINLLKSGSAVLLFDGLDEISLELRKGVEEKINAFADAYSNNPMIISSRPYSQFLALDQFTRYRLCPFSPDQALMLIEKLDFQSDIPELKQRFIRALKERLFRTHTEFTQNPLLLTLMLMTFNYNGDIPQELTGFYREAFETLAKRHDASKPGLERIMATHLDTDGLSQLLSLFCALSFVNHCYDYLPDEIAEYYDKAKELFVGKLDASVEEFITDIKDNICLMYYEDARYHYIHRSFQEYFTALYFSKINDDKLPNVADFVNQTGLSSIYMLEMLYAMIPRKVEQFIFLPYLKTLFDSCDKDDVDPYYSFICTQYPYLQATDGETCESADNSPRQALYRFIAEKAKAKKQIDTYMFPTDEFYVDRGYVYATEDPEFFNSPEKWELMEEDSIPDMFLDALGQPERAGVLCSYDMYDIVHDADDSINMDIIEIINSDTFSLKNEYIDMRRYTVELEKKYSKPASGDFGLF